MIYLDNAATTPPRPEVVAAAVEALEAGYGNPSSAHGLGLAAERLVRAAREAVAAGLRADPGEIVFTSGGTEANNLALLGAARALRRRGDRVIATRIEHPSVLRACEVLAEEGFRVTYLDVDGRGLVDPADLARALTPETILVTTMHINNEVGSVQPLEAIARALGRSLGRTPRAATAGAAATAAAATGATTGARLPVWHVDAVQSFGKLPLDPSRLGVDLVALSAHKVHGPKGCGALYVRRGLPLRPLLVGGGQEGGLRAGTENVPGIAGLAAAASLASAEREAAAGRMAALRRRLIDGVLAAVPWARLNGPVDAPDAAPHIASLSFPGLRGEVLLHALEERGVYVSTGAACSARRAEPSHVLRALGLGPAEVEGTIRFSLSPLTTAAEVDTAVQAVTAVAAELRGFVRR